jgi:hypothetical protein
MYEWKLDEREGKSHIEKWMSMGFEKREENAKEGQGYSTSAHISV